jgi:putative oxidoreductase
MCLCTYITHLGGQLVNVALLLLHAFIGAALIAHAMQKLFVFRLDGTAAYLRSFGFRAPRLMALAVIGTEFSGGILLGLGLLLPVGAMLVASTMLVAARTDHRGRGWFITGSGVEFVATNAVVAVALAGSGGGKYSLDRALSLHASGLSWAVGAALAGIAGAGLVLSRLFRRVPDTAARRTSFDDAVHLEDAGEHQTRDVPAMS